jgi:hypothetical protein
MVAFVRMPAFLVDSVGIGAVGEALDIKCYVGNTHRSAECEGNKG